MVSNWFQLLIQLLVRGMDFTLLNHLVATLTAGSKIETVNKKISLKIIEARITYLAYAPEIAAEMVSNLLIVLCGNKDAQPVVNSGSLY